jgi:sigma-B regulation protein RsbU (phosphoserine phosphatase)
LDRPTRSILVADDSTAQRRMLALQLARWGYRVVEATDGQEALALARAQDFDIVLSDWMMPGLTGPELCRAFRALPRDGYGYFVLLSARSEKTDIAAGLESGADDFLAKPVDSAELLARLHAGERILGMQAELRRRNADLEHLYAALRRDLEEARDFQSSLMPDPQLTLGPATATFMMQPSGHLGGDLVGHFRIDDHRIALWSLDIAGHGVASALLAARLAGLLSDRSRDQNLAFRDGRPLRPAQVVDRLNRLLCNDRRSDQYLTMLYAELCLTTGTVTLVQAGHPHPVLMTTLGPVALGTGGFPVGLIPEADFTETTLTLTTGDRLAIPSDGITECPGASGDLGQDGLIRLLPRLTHTQGSPLNDALLHALSDHAGTRDFPDDVSAIILDWHP